MIKALPLILFALLAGCQPSHSDTNLTEINRTMPELSTTESKLAFTCVYEKDHPPELNPQTDQLYRYARWLRNNQIEKEDPLRHPEMERYYRIATAHGHYKANFDLREMLRNGNAISKKPTSEVIDLTQSLIDRGIPGSYYDMAIYLQQGYGVQQDSHLAQQYFRKAADLGNPEAQYVVGDMLMEMTVSHPIPYAVGRSMKKCAAEQGHGRAALEYALSARDKNLPEAVQYLHLAAKAGDESGASRLAHGFQAPPQSDLHYLGLNKDEERSRRYEAIWSILSDYSYANPKVPELDDIVPLPPAKLPAWNGKLKWLEEFKANQLQRNHRKNSCNNKLRPKA